jgi:tetratricopeptide (TPR) repeat protein
MSEPRLRQALAHLQRGELDEARTACRELLEANGDDAQALHLLGTIEMRGGRPQPAAEALRRAAELAPDAPQVRLALGLCLANTDADAAVAELLAAATIADQAALQTQIGEALGNLGRVPEAEASFRRALEIDRRHVPAMFNLGLALLATGRLEEAAQALAQVTRRRPKMPNGWLQLGGTLNALGRYEAAEQALKRHLALSPDSAHGWTWLGASLQYQGRFDDAEQAYRRALALAPDLADALANLGKLKQAQDDPDVAEPLFRRALAARPDHAQARSGLAAWLDNQGRYEEALELVRAAPAGTESLVAPIHARVLRHLDRREEARALLESALGLSGLTADAAIQLRFSLGQLLDDCGEYEPAWEHVEEANRLRRERLPPGVPERDLQEMDRAVSELVDAFSARSLEILPRAALASERPVFVVGMPRTGKSIVEQILCSHPRVHGAGELTDIGDISAELEAALGPWPGAVVKVSADQLDAAAGRYLRRLTERAGDAARVTDTMPFNFVHLGLIELLFPGARVVHCVRHPLDLMLRCYFKNFAGRTLAFAFDLEAIARYLESYQRLMAHWREVSSLVITEVAYEALTGDPEREIRRLVEALGLDWDPRCLRFFEPGVAGSAAATPLRRPLHRREVGGWAHYASHLRPYAGRLGAADYPHGRES